MITESFKGDFDFFIDNIKNENHFTLSRWGDGELMILNGTNLDLTKKGNGEFKYVNGNPMYEKSKLILNDSFTYKDDNYYIGIGCRCCIGDSKFENMKIASKQNSNKLTWANIFVNSNFRYVKTDLIPLLNTKNVNIVCNNKSSFDNFPINVKNIWKVGTDAWVNDLDIFNKISNYINNNNIKNEIFLFASGPLSNILSYKLHLNSTYNTYVDIGSIFDEQLGLKLTRGYQLGASTLNKVCIW